MRPLRKTINQAPPTYAFVVDGQTEVWYLQMLKRNERHLKFNIKPEIPSKKSIEDQYDLVIKLSNQEYTKVFWVVDLDILIKESRVGLPGKNNSLRMFKALRNKVLRDYNNVEVIINNPCLEFWFLLHFEQTSKLFNTCSNAESDLGKYLMDYRKTQKYFTKQNDDIYLKLKPSISTAIRNATLMGNFDGQNHMKPICEMFSLFKSEVFNNQY